MSARASIALLLASACSILGCAGDSPGPTVPLDPATPAFGAVTGTVSGGTWPVIGASVTLDGGSTTLQRTTGTDETFAFDEVTPGEYTVAATAAGLACPVRSATVRAADTTAVDLICQPSGERSVGGAIYIANADGTNAIRLTRGDHPDWSPAGAKIAFERDGRIHVVEADGSNETRLARGTAPDWSPDGRRIVFAELDCSLSCGTGRFGIAVMNADGSGLTRLVGGDVIESSSLGVGNPAWSPDGQWIAFEHLGDGDMRPHQIYVMRADGGQPRRLTSEAGTQYAESDPEWSPDGSRVAFWSYGHGIATVTLGDPSHPTSLYRNFPFVHYGAKPAWAPDGGSVAFTAEGPSVYLLDLAGDDPRRLIGRARRADWSPDGTRIAFVRP